LGRNVPYVTPRIQNFSSPTNKNLPFTLGRSHKASAGAEPASVLKCRSPALSCSPLALLPPGTRRRCAIRALVLAQISPLPNFGKPASDSPLSDLREDKDLSSTCRPCATHKQNCRGGFCSLGHQNLHCSITAIKLLLSLAFPMGG